MLLAEPPRTKYDLQFKVDGIPVRVHPFFWVATVLLGISGGPSPLPIAVWVLVAFLSILVHELGHAWAFRRYGCRPRITLYSMGGLASADETWGADGPHQRVVIAAAGPGAGFALAGIALALLHYFGYSASFLGWTLWNGRPITHPAAFLFVHDLLWINIFWGLVNLAPVIPLDGSQIWRGLVFWRDPRGNERELRVSVLSGALLALLGAFMGSSLMALFFGWLAYSSYRGLREGHGARVFEGGAFDWLGRAWRARKRKSERKRRAHHLRLADEQVADSIRESDEREEHVSPEVQQTAQNLLRAISDEIREERKTPRPGDEKE